MVLEAVAAALVGAALLWLILEPLVVPAAPTPAAVEPAAPEETPRGMALAALKEIEFDRETGKLSDADYADLKAKYTAAALEALRREDEGAATPGDAEPLASAQVHQLRSASVPTAPGAATCPSCGLRPEPDALYCSNCGRRLAA